MSREMLLDRHQRAEQAATHINIEHAVLIGQGALVALQQETGHQLALPSQLVMSVNDAEFHRLQQAHPPDAHGALRPHDSLQVVNGWGTTPHQLLAHNAVSLEAGLQVASLKDVHDNNAKDPSTVAQIEKMLREDILPASFLQKHIDFVQNLFQEGMEGVEEIKENPLLRVAAHGLFMIEVRFERNYYKGKLEKEGVFAGYHKLAHTADGLPIALQHALLANQADQQAGRPKTFDWRDTLALLISYGIHDAELGNGREANDQQEFDEKRAGELAHNLIMKYGEGHLSEDDLRYIAAGAKSGIEEGTAFTESTGTQKIDYTSQFAHIQVGTGGTDLHTLYSRKGPYESLLVAGEDLMRKAMADQYHQALTKVTTQVSQEKGQPVYFTSAEEQYAFFDEYGSRPVPGAPQNRTLTSFLVQRLKGNAWFTHPDGFQFPTGWHQEDREQRIINANLLTTASQEMERSHRPLMPSAALRRFFNLAAQLD